MKLSEWLEQHSMSESSFADKLGVHRSTVGRWCDGETIPRRDQFPRIVELTLGEVTPNDFMAAMPDQRTEVAAA